MFRISKHVSSISQGLLRFHFSQSTEPALVPLVIDNSKTFLSTVYGIKTEKHILPLNVYNFNWKAEEIKDYRKKMPNYVVVLVNKVLEDS